MADDQFNCPACGTNFQSKQELDEHAKQAHSKQTGEEQQEHSITCSKCGFKAKVSEQMDEHNKGHMGSGQM